MNKRATAISYGAVTIINAIASGVGSALGIDLWTKAKVEVFPGNEIEAIISNDKNEDSNLIKMCVAKVFKNFNIKDLGAKIKTDSNIPIARGLKSSSAAANAVTLATIKALDIKISDLEIVKIGVDASIESKVSITGAFDDATASYFGGIVLTNNSEKELIMRKEIGENNKVVIYIPERKILTKTVDVPKIKLIKNLISPLIKLIKEGNPYHAMSLNGFLYGACLNSDLNFLFKALKTGALGVSVSGTGPSIAAIIDEKKVDKLVKSWSNNNGEVKVVNINNQKAHVLQ